jgi:hypothetical protein
VNVIGTKWVFKNK